MAINIPCHDNTRQSLFDPGKCFKTQQSGIFFFFFLMPLYLLVAAALAVPSQGEGSMDGVCGSLGSSNTGPSGPVRQRITLRRTPSLRADGKGEVGSCCLLPRGLFWSRAALSRNEEVMTPLEIWCAWLLSPGQFSSRGGAQRGLLVVGLVQIAKKNHQLG